MIRYLKEKLFCKTHPDNLPELETQTVKDCLQILNTNLTNPDDFIAIRKSDLKHVLEVAFCRGYLAGKKER